MFVGNLSYRTTKEQLQELFSQAGSVVDVYVPLDRETGKPRGFAFVQFSSDSEAAEAIRLFHEKEVDGRRLNVNEAQDKRPGGPPRGGGGPRGYMPPPPQAFGVPEGDFGDRGSSRGGDDESGGRFDEGDYGGGGGGGGGRPPPRRIKKGGSRRGLRARKRDY